MSRRPGEWSRSEAAAFTLALSVLPTSRLGSAGVDYEAVADLCEALGRPRPSQLGEERRLLLLAWLLTPPGRAALSRTAAAREQLIAEASEHDLRTRKLAAIGAGLVDPKTGKPHTAPRSMSARELWLLIGAIPLPVRAVDAPAGHQKCEDCGIVILSARARCPSCGSQLLWRAA